MPVGDVDALVAMLAPRRRVVAFTGAGVSTESGIPDFRSPTGIWTRYDPRNFTFDRYVADPDVRRQSWEMRRALRDASAEPNPAHRALAALEQAGRSPGVVTQNIDGLHQAAGSRTVVEVHGTAREVACIGLAPPPGTPDGCGWRAPLDWALAEIDGGSSDPGCPTCGGIVKAATVSFGQAMPAGPWEQAAQLCASADLLLAIGSSLQVEPAASLPLLAASNGAAVVILNAEPTPLDHHVDLVVRGRAGEVLGPAVQAVLDDG